MCSLKYSKTILPFAITFIFGLFIANLVLSFVSSSNVNEPKVNEVKVYSSINKHNSCQYKKVRTEERIVKPTFEQTIIINEEVKKIRR